MKSKRPFSIKRRLTLSVVLLSTLLIVITLFFSFASARHEIKEVYDARLGQSAKLLLLNYSLLSTQSDQTTYQQTFERWMQDIHRLAPDDDDGPTQYGHPYEQNIVFQFYQQGELLWSSDNKMGEVEHQVDSQGFGYFHNQQRLWRSFQLPLNDQRGTHIIVAEKQSIRDEIIDEIALSTALPQIILIPCLAFMITLLIGKNFQPISELRVAIAQRSAHRLDKIVVANETQELSPLVDSLNNMLEQLSQAWQREKRFTRMAAHELKTPLTVLRLNAENALSSQNRQQLDNDLNNILKGIDRTDRLIHQLLTLAKVESTSHIESKEIELDTLIKRLMAMLAPFALKRHQALEFVGGSGTLMGDEMLLEVLFKNLLDNAIRYAGEGCEIKVTIDTDDQGLKVHVADNGPNLSAETRAKLFDNFYRANTEQGDGAGLGMSIVRDIALLHNGQVTLLPRTNERNIFEVRFFAP